MSPDGHPLGPLALQPYPESDPRWIDEDIERQFGIFQDVVLVVRSLRKDAGIKDGTKVRVTLVVPDLESAVVLTSMHPYVVHMSRASEVDLVDEPGHRDPSWHRPEGTVFSTTPSGVEVHIRAGDAPDPAAEMERLTGRIEEAERERSRISSKLANEQFVSRAPSDVVQRERSKLAEVEASLAAMSSQVDTLSQLVSRDEE